MTHNRELEIVVCNKSRGDKMKTHHIVFDLWCRWCVDHKCFVPFERWMNYTHPVEPIGRAILDYTQSQDD